MDNNIKVSKEQIRFMRTVQRKNEYVFKSSDMCMVMYLCQNGLLTQYTKSSNLNYCKLTELGKAYLYSYKIENRFRYLPIAISIVALIVSAAAIILSPFFQAYFTVLFGLQ